MPTCSLTGLLPLEAAIPAVFMFFWPNLPRQICSPGVLFPHHLQPPQPLTLAVTSPQHEKGALYTLQTHRSWPVPMVVSLSHPSRL